MQRDSTIFNNLINFTSTRKMTGVFVTPFFFNSIFFQRLKILKGVDGPFVYESKKILNGRTKSIDDKKTALFFFKF